MLENALKAVDENTNMDVGLRENIKELVAIFSKFFPQISLENFEKRIKGVKIEETNKFVSKNAYDYIPQENKLYFSQKMLEKYDAKHMLMSALLCMMTAHDNTYGFDVEKKLVTFNIGYTEILSTFLVGNESEHLLYEDEVIATQIMGEMIGEDTFFEAYFTNNSKLILERLAQIGDDNYARNH